MDEIICVEFDYAKYAAWKKGRFNKISKLSEEWLVEGYSVFTYLADILHCNGNKPIHRKHNPEIQHLWRPDILKRFLDDCVKYKLLCTDGRCIWLPDDMINPFHLAEGRFLNKSYEHTFSE